MKANILPLSASLAQTITISLSAFPIHLLFPLRSQPPSTYLAVVFNSDASDPISFSVKPHPPIISKSLSLGIYRALYSSDPRTSIECVQRPHLLY